MTGDDLKKRWKNLRDSYSKYLRTEKTRTGQEMKCLDKYKTWPWAKQMEFLRSSLQFSKTETNLPHLPLDQEEMESDHNSENRQDDENEQGVHQQQNTPSIPRNTPVLSRKRRTQEATPFSTATQQVLTYLKNREASTPTHDKTDLLFMSYAKTVKTFSERRQTMVKYKIAKIMMEEELAQQEESNQNNYYTSERSNSSGPTTSSSVLSYHDLSNDLARNVATTSWQQEFGSSLETYENL